MNPPLRVALFTDTFYEANGVATLSRQLAAFAQSRGLPLLVVRGSGRSGLTSAGSVQTLELKRGPASFPLDKHLYCDPLLCRHRRFVADQLREFQPDLVHVTGPGDVGILGLLVSHALRVPLVASWHTNLHEYFAKRLDRVLSAVPKKLRQRASRFVENQTLRGLLRFYRTPAFVLAPNSTLVDLLHTRTGRPAFLMPHGVDLSAYHALPAYHARPHGTNGDRPFCIGYVGRVTAEKNVRVFPELEARLLAAGERNFKFLIVGEGGQRKWIQNHLQSAEVPGVLEGEALAAAYRRMDAFVFPSRTDTFGLAILEAMASGVPVILHRETGERVGIQQGVTGFLSDDFVASLQCLMHNHALQQAMSSAARTFASSKSWDLVFEELYRAYTHGLTIKDRRREQKEAGR